MVLPYGTFTFTSLNPGVPRNTFWEILIRGNLYMRFNA
jgi:hypothetical protein